MRQPSWPIASDGVRRAERAACAACRRRWTSWTVAWAIELAEPLPPNHAAAGRRPRRRQHALSDGAARTGTNVYALVRTLSSGTAFTWHYEAGDRRFGGSQLEVWETASRQPRARRACRRGPCAQMPPWESTDLQRARSATGGCTCRRSTAPEAPAAVMVFQDGNGPRALGARPCSTT